MQYEVVENVGRKKCQLHTNHSASKKITNMFRKLKEDSWWQRKTTASTSMRPAGRGTSTYIYVMNIQYY